MLYYKSFPEDFLLPDAAIQLPSLSCPCFSKDGRYLTFRASVDENSFPEGWLVDTENWEVKKIINDRIVITPSFSQNNKYWLVPGEKPLIFELTEDIH